MLKKSFPSTSVLKIARIAILRAATPPRFSQNRDLGSRRRGGCHRVVENTNATVFLCTTSSKIIYVNQEQTPKSPSEGVTQQALTSAFTNHQRQSKYLLKYAGAQYLLLSGKNTGRIGVLQMKGPDGNDVDVSDFERTLIDVVVRPAYAGGINQVADAYKQAANKVDIDYMIKLLKKLQYVYPYHQSIGFLLERAGRSEEDCRRLKNLGTELDFYLDYKMKNPAYNQKWRLYYPLQLN
jgi:hypothetical protein